MRAAQPPGAASRYRSRVSDRPTEPADPTASEQGERPDRSLSEILEELALLSHAQQGEASEMRSAVSELSRALARLFEMIRTDRREQHARIAQLEREVAAAREQLAALGVEPLVPPAPNDFDQLRAAAERLRMRTEQLVRDAALPAREPAVSESLDGPPVPVDSSAEAAGGAEPSDAGADVGVETPTDASAEPEDAADAAELEQPAEPEAPLAPLVDAGVLRVLPGAAPEPLDGDLDVESELPLAREQAVALPVPKAAPVNDAVDASAPAGDDGERAVEQPVAEASEASPEPVDDQPATEPSASTQAPARPEPVPVGPRPARKRRFAARRRRIDARKLTDVEPTSALGSMVAAVPQLWTAGCTVDLVIAFIDGGAVRVAGGDRTPLRVEEVEPGTPARCTITASRRQLVPLFGRLELTGDASAPLIHGSRRDADLLVGWFDRAQRLAVEPL